MGGRESYLKDKTKLKNQNNDKNKNSSNNDKKKEKAGKQVKQDDGTHESILRQHAGFDGTLRSR